MIGSSSLATKFLITWRMVSVDNTVEMPNLLPRREDSVDFPVPEVPASKTSIFLLDSISQII
jgi:hypothetical protein